MNKKLIALLLAALMILGLAPLSAFAGSEVIITSGSSVGYIDENGESHTVTAEQITSESTELGSGWFYVNANTGINSTRVSVTGTADEPTRIILKDNTTLSIPCGVTVAEGRKLIIYAQSTGDHMGKLTVSGPADYNAGIGGADGLSCGSVCINGGDITVTGGNQAAGIGGGRNGGGGSITINGGKINATSDNHGAGIGGGSGFGGGGVGGGGSGIIMITGGEVTATCNSRGAGIGGGFMGSGESIITVSGGTVTASSIGGAGIGGGEFGSVGTINITGGTVTASADTGSSSYGGAGIGGGHQRAGGVINISGGKVTANGGTAGCSIGYGYGYTGPTDAITLDWTTADDYIKTDKGYSGTVNIAAGKHFTEEGNLTADHSGNNVTLPADAKLIPTGYLAYIDENGSTGYALSPTQIIGGSDNLSAGWYYASSGQTNVTSRLTVSGTVNIILKDGSELNVPQGITVHNNNTLNIYAQSTGESAGRLLINGVENNCAGIGGMSSGAGSINIYGGTVTATGGVNAAGIGGGNQGAGGNITIGGGTVTATGGLNAAGIGGGNRGAGGIIKISGGTVTADGKGGGAGIGNGNSGSSGSGSSITISGGTVTASGGDFGAGIGGGNATNSSSIIISGGTVTAYGGTCAAGIGGGNNSSGGRITINGGEVIATGGGQGAGIGGGSGSSGGYIEINGGTVTAAGGGQAAGIGGGSGNSGNGGNITINDGTVVATGGGYAAGIGGGSSAWGGTIIINGGTVTASGVPASGYGLGGAGIGSGFINGNSAYGGNITISGGIVIAVGDNGGAGIGGGQGSSGDRITITGGTVTATGGDSAEPLNEVPRGSGAGIGGGCHYLGKGGDGGIITITGGKVTATGGSRASSIGTGEEGTTANITLGWTGTTDFIKDDNLKGFSGTVTIASGRLLCDADTNRSFSGEVSDNSLLTGLTLRPAYSVIFCKNDGSEAPDTLTQIFVYHSLKALPSGLFTREGFTLAGWNTAADGTGTGYSDGESVVNIAGEGVSVTLYAVWRGADAPSMAFTQAQIRGSYTADSRNDIRYIFTLTFNKTKLLVDGSYAGCTGDDCLYQLCGFEARVTGAQDGHVYFDWDPFNNIYSVTGNTSCTVSIVLANIPLSMQATELKVDVRYAYRAVNGENTVFRYTASGTASVEGVHNNVGPANPPDPWH